MTKGDRKRPRVLIIDFSFASMRMIRIWKWAVTYLPNIFIFLEADVLGGRLDSKKWVQAYFTWPKFSVVGKSRYLMNQSYVATNTVR